MVTVGESSTLQQNLNKLSGIYWIGSMSPSRLLQSWGKVNLKSEHTHSVCTFPTIPHSWQKRALMQHSGESEHDREGEQTADRCWYKGYKSGACRWDLAEETKKYRYAKGTLCLWSEVWKKMQAIAELMQYRWNNICLAFRLQSDMIRIKTEESSFQGPSKQQALRRKRILQA